MSFNTRWLEIAATLCLVVTIGVARADDKPAPKPAAATSPYSYGPDSSPQDVPHGTVSAKQEIVSSRAYPGVHHEYVVYVPAQYDGKTPAAVMVFNDGLGFANPKGAFRVPVVFDNLIAKKLMPVTIAIMINPGVLPPADEKTQLPRFARSYQYDTLSDRYARLLIEEVLPKVGKEYKLTDDPNLRAIAGSSSGGICAFTVAWERPDAFRRVVSFIGSFTNLRNGDRYPDLIRKTEPKPIRVFQQDGSNDLNIYAGSWPAANQDIAAALDWAGYPHHFEFGVTAHDSKQSGPLFPEAIKWVWQDWDKPIGITPNPKQPVMEIVDPSETWQVVSEGHKFTEGPAVDGQGNFYFSDIPANRIYKVAVGGKPEVFAENTNGANGLKYHPDGRLFACQGNANRVVAYDLKTAKETVIAEKIESPNDLVISNKGDIYVTEPPKGQVWHIAPNGSTKIVVEKKVGLQFPNGIGLTPDQSQLVVDDTKGTNFWIFQVQPDGSLVHGAPFYTAQIGSMDRDSGADGLCFDTDGRLYVATRLGVQVFDQAGRVNAIIPPPIDAKVRNQWLANVTIGGKDRSTLYITCGDHVYSRKVKVKGSQAFEPPTKPEKPRL